MDTTTAKRDFLFDNYKAVLIVLVIMGHFTDLNYGNNAFLYNLKWLIDLDRRQTVYTYCASCSGAFTRKGYKAEHLLLKILGREETADVKKSLLNRVKSRYWRKKKR